MSVTHLRRLGLSAELVDRRIDFLSLYANTCLEDANASDPEADDERQSYEHAAALADAATSLAEAAALATIFRPQLALQLFESAALAYSRLGYPYGLYLGALAGSTRIGDGFGRAMSWFQATQQPISPREQVPLIWHAPQQQVYFLLAAATFSRGEGREALIGAANAS